MNDDLLNIDDCIFLWEKGGHKFESVLGVFPHEYVYIIQTLFRVRSYLDGQITSIEYVFEALASSLYQLDIVSIVCNEICVYH